MSLFGLFYSLKLISLFFTNDKVSEMKKSVFEACIININLGLGVIIFIIGLIITIFFILKKQDLSSNENENAFIFDITKLEDKTDNLFFSASNKYFSPCKTCK
jgi:beta-lactamase regulating signal transducer with metallopeptidase domain